MASSVCGHVTSLPLSGLHLSCLIRTYSSHCQFDFFSYKLQSLLPGPIKMKGSPSYKPKAKVWVTSAVFYSELSKLVLSTTSSDIYFISFLPPSSLTAQYQLTELPSPVFALATHEQDGMFLLLCGCADGSLLVLRFLCPEQGLFSQEIGSKREECMKVSGRNVHKYHEFVAAATYQVRGVLYSI